MNATAETEVCSQCGNVSLDPDWCLICSWLNDGDAQVLIEPTEEA